MVAAIVFSLALNIQGMGATTQPLSWIKSLSESTPLDERCWITGNSVRMRSRPSRNGDILAVFTKGEQVKIIRSHDVTDDWGNVVEAWYLVRRRSGAEGWVHEDYVDCNGC
jgi:uncharacterized protein YgiM (DUF1202 family)